MCVHIICKTYMFFLFFFFRFERVCYVSLFLLFKILFTLCDVYTLSLFLSFLLDFIYMHTQIWIVDRALASLLTNWKQNHRKFSQHGKNCLSLALSVCDCAFSVFAAYRTFEEGKKGRQIRKTNAYESTSIAHSRIHTVSRFVVFLLSFFLYFQFMCIGWASMRMSNQFGWMESSG